MEIVTQLIYDDPELSRIYSIHESNLMMQIISRDDNEYLNKHKNLLQKHCLYILVGNETLSARRKIYIGQTADMFKRFQQHVVKKDFWTECMVFTLIHSQFNRSQIQYLEYLSILSAIECGIYDMVQNCQIPKKPFLDERDTAFVEKVFDDVKLLALFAGFRMFRNKVIDLNDVSVSGSHTILSRIVNEYNNSSKTSSRSDYVSEYDSDEDLVVSYELKGNDFYAKAVYTNDGSVMVMPFGYISHNVDVSDLSDVSSCIDISSFYIRSGFVVDSLDVAGRLITGCDDNKWKKIITYI